MINFSKITNKIKTMDSTSKKLIINSNLSLVIKGASLFVSLFTLPAYMFFFKQQEVLGFWFTALSILSWILTFDFGIGNGLRNYLVKPLVENNKIEVRRYISSSYIMIGAVVVVVSALGYFIIPFINWTIVFNISNKIIPNDILINVVRLIFIGIMIQFLLRLITSVYFAMQKSAMPSFLTLTSSVILLIFVSVANSGNTINNLENLSLVYIITSNLPLLIATIVVFSTNLKDCIPNIKFFNIRYAMDVLKLGGMFFWLQIMSMLIFNTNEFLITWFIGPAKVVDYSIYNKMFGVVGMLFAIAVTPVWSAVTEAHTNENYIWIRKLYKKLKNIGIVAASCSIILVFTLQYIVNLWLRDKAIAIDWRYSIIFAVSTIIYMWISINASIANGIGKLKVQFIFITIGAIINIPLSYLFALITKSWISIVVANIISMLPYSIIQPLILNKWLNNKIELKS